MRFFFESSSSVACDRPRISLSKTKRLKLFFAQILGSDLFLSLRLALSIFFVFLFCEGLLVRSSLEDILIFPPVGVGWSVCT